MKTTVIDHIVVDDKGIARIAGSRLKVIHLVMERTAHGWGPTEMQREHPGLTAEQAAAALDYYEAHRAELDAAIEAGLTFAEEAKTRNGPSAFAARTNLEFVTFAGTPGEFTDRVEFRDYRNCTGTFGKSCIQPQRGGRT